MDIPIVSKFTSKKEKPFSEIYREYAMAELDRQSVNKKSPMDEYQIAERREAVERMASNLRGIENLRETARKRNLENFEKLNKAHEKGQDKGRIRDNLKQLYGDQAKAQKLAQPESMGGSDVGKTIKGMLHDLNGEGKGSIFDADFTMPQKKKKGAEGNPAIKNAVMANKRGVTMENLDIRPNPPESPPPSVVIVKEPEPTQEELDAKKIKEEPPIEGITI